MAMKILKGLLIGLILLLLVFLIIAAVLPGEYEVQQTIDVKLQPDRTYTILTDFEYLVNWDPEFSDTNISSYEIRGDSAQLLHAISWQSVAFGNGSYEITQLTPNEYIQILKEYTDSNEFELISWEFRPLRGDSSSVIYTVRGNLGYPMGRFAHLFEAAPIETEITARLQALKRFLESQ